MDIPGGEEVEEEDVKLAWEVVMAMFVRADAQKQGASLRSQSRARVW